MIKHQTNEAETDTLPDQKTAYSVGSGLEWVTKEKKWFRV